MTLRQLEYLIAVADSGSFSAAAENLHISQPPLSTQIRNLEEELGVILFERNTRYIRLTDTGRNLCERARQILDLCEEAREETRNPDQTLKGRLIIGAISSCGTLLAGPELARFTRDHPNVTFELVEGNTLILLDKLRKRELDLTFVRTPFDPEGLDIHPIRREPLCAAATPNVMSGQGSVSLSKLSSYPLIFYRRYEALFRNAFSEEGLTPRVRCINDDARTTLMWACAGLGVGLLPRSIIDSTDRRDLVIRPIDHAGFSTEVAIACRKGQYLPPAAKAFIHYFENVAGRLA